MNNVPLIYKRRPVLGFDLGSASAKIVQMKSGGSKVSGYTQASYPRDAIVEGIVVDPEPIAEALRPAMRRAAGGRLTAGRVVACLPTAVTFIRVIDLPHMTDGELDSAVRLEAEQYVPVPIAHLYLDYEVISRDGKGSTVLMVAAPSAIVDSYVLLFNLLGLETIAIEPNIISTVRAVDPSALKDKVALIVDIESESTNVAIYDKSIRLTNTVAIGGQSITDQLSKKMGLSPEKAEEIKIKFGVNETDLGARIGAVLEPTIISLAKELKKIADYYNGQEGIKRPVDTILLAGGTANLPGLIDKLSDITKLSTSVLDPWAVAQTSFGVKAPEKTFAASYAAAIGLAKLGAKL